MPLDKYESYSGLSQDEFKTFLNIRKMYNDKSPYVTLGQLKIMIHCLEQISEGRANRIKELEEELIDAYLEYSKEINDSNT